MPGVYELAPKDGNNQALLVYPSTKPHYNLMFSHFLNFLDFLEVGEIHYAFQKSMALALENETHHQILFDDKERRGFALLVGLMAELNHIEKKHLKHEKDVFYNLYRKEMAKYKDLLDDVYGKD